MGLLEGRIAVITGGSRGMGAAEARLFAREGAQVVICDMLESEGAALAKEISATGPEARFHKLDVSEESDWDALVEFMSSTFGKVDILINNAGITHRAGIHKTDLAQWEKVMGVNLTGTFLGIKKMSALMRSSGRGSIVNIASAAGLSGYHSVSYGSSKWGVIGLTKCAAIELVDWNIRVNAICPGVIDTPLARNSPINYETTMRMIPQARAGQPEEIAQLILFLASDQSSFITGEEIAIDGGMMGGGLFRYIARETGVFPKEPDSV